MKPTNGFTIQIAFGGWATPHVQVGDVIKLRVCLGLMAISFIGMDMENFQVNQMNRIKQLESKRERL